MIFNHKKTSIKFAITLGMLCHAAMTAEPNQYTKPLNLGSADFKPQAPVFRVTTNNNIGLKAASPAFTPRAFLSRTVQRANGTEIDTPTRDFAEPLVFNK